MDRLRVVVADDDPMVRGVLRRTLTDAGIDVVAETATGHDAEARVLEHEPDLVVLDLDMLDTDPLGVTRRITEGAPAVAIVVLATREDDDLAIAALRAGASGFLTKDMAVEALPRALRAAAAGEAAVSRRLVKVLIDRLRKPPLAQVGTRPVRSDLTRREWEVLDLICTGLTTDEIADTLVLSLETVRSHVKRILRKTGSRSRAEAVERAATLRLPASAQRGA